ncbi:MAG: AbrB family transcriptional regulator [Promethearchaeati archaeon SRVP18_Atabeyarchaeia-1]
MQVTTLTRARPETESLRTTLPNFIVKLYNLKQGDKILWDTRTTSKGKLIIIVKPITQTRKQANDTFPPL